MALDWVTRLKPGTHLPECCQHLAFQWRDCGIVETACGLEFDGEGQEWVRSDFLVAVDRPQIITCPECEALTVEQVAELYGRWQRGEPR